MLQTTKFNLLSQPQGKHDSLLFIPFRYISGEQCELFPYEKTVQEAVPEAFAQYIDTASKGALFPGELSVSRHCDGWGTVVFSPVTVRQSRFISPHYFAPYCRSAMKSVRYFVESGFDIAPTIYISLPSDDLGSSAIVRAAREEFEYAGRFVAGLFAKPIYSGEARHFTKPIQFSSVIGGVYDSCPELGIDPLYHRKRATA